MLIQKIAENANWSKLTNEILRRPARRRTCDIHAYVLLTKWPALGQNIDAWCASYLALSRGRISAMSANDHRSIPTPPEQRVAALESVLEARVPGAKAFINEHVRTATEDWVP